AEQPVEALGPPGRAQRPTILILDAGDVLLASGVAKLQDEPAIVFMHRLADRPPERNLVVVVDRCIARNDPSADAHWDKRRDDGSDSAARELHLPVQARLTARSVVVVEPP